MTSLPKLTVIARFAEDIRKEADGKSSLMGLFSGAIYLEQIPAMMPKLGIALFLHTPTSNPIRSIDLSIQMPGTDIITPLESISSDVLSELTAAVVDPEVASYTVSMLLVPFHVTQYGRLKIFASVNGETVEAGRLLFTDVEGRQKSMTKTFSRAVEADTLRPAPDRGLNKPGEWTSDSAGR